MSWNLQEHFIQAYLKKKIHALSFINNPWRFSIKADCWIFKYVHISTVFFSVSVSLHPSCLWWPAVFLAWLPHWVMFLSITDTCSENEWKWKKLFGASHQHPETSQTGEDERPALFKLAFTSFLTIQSIHTNKDSRYTKFRFLVPDLKWIWLLLS